jgi:iron(III) transport system permease protein
MAVLPLFSPPFTIGFSYLLMFGRFGVITHGLFGFEASILGWWSLWAVQTLSNFPYATLAIERALAATPPTLEAAARDLGGGWLAVFRTITLPLARPAVAGAALLVAIYIPCSQPRPGTGSTGGAIFGGQLCWPRRSSLPRFSCLSRSATG